MTFHKALGSFLTLGLLSACTSLPAGSGTPAGGATLEIRPMVKAGGYTAQAVVERYTRDSIDHLTITLQRKAPVQEELTSQSIAQDELDQTVRFSNLKANSTYWIEAKAYKAANESLPENLISEPATAAITVTNDDAVIVLEGQAFGIQLKDVEFNGIGSTMFGIQDGGYVTTAPATLSLVTPPAP